MSNFLEKDREIREKLSRISIVLEDKVDALHAVGLSDLGGFLLLVVNDLDKINKEIKTMVDDEFNHSFQQAKDTSSGMLQAALAGIELATNSELKPSQDEALFRKRIK